MSDLSAAVAAPAGRSTDGMGGRISRNLRALRLMNDAPSALRLLGLKLTRRRGGSAGLVRLALKPLHGAAVVVRRGTADRWAIRDAFLPPAHLPPPALAADRVAVIWDLGANIGLTMAHMAVLFPRARIFGVELDAANAELCRTNVSSWADRCRVIRAAAWLEDGTVDYGYRAGDEFRFRVEAETGGGDADRRTARAISLNSLLAHGRGGRVDYVKMDIEGAERHVLRHNTEWAAHVRSIKVEVHPPYTVAECLADLERLGFEAFADSASNGMPQVAGIRGSQL